MICAVRAGRKANKVTRPYSRSLQGATSHIAVLGDSMMYGAGVKDPIHTMGGLLAEKFPNASIETVAFNGAKVKDLSAQIKSTTENHYRVMMIGIGGNDIVGLSNFGELEKNLCTFFNEAQNLADILILFHCVNLGNIGFFPFPLNYLYDYRTRKISGIFKKITKNYTNVQYVNFYRSPRDDFYTSKTRKEFIADDSFHPSDYANQFFFNLIWKAVPELSVMAKPVK